MRADLIALTDDDLVALTNRGTVKRARQEADELTVELDEDESGQISARWGDAGCLLPPGKPLGQARCTCPAPPPCRHLVRTVFAYQKQAPAEPARALPWDPGAISDDALSAVASKAALTRAARLDESGQVVEVVRAIRPTARCHSVGVSVRFLVPGDPAYALCDCGQPAPCEHAILAVRAFRDLPESAAAGLIERGGAPSLTATERAALAAGEAAVRELTRVGLADAPAPLMDRLRRAEDTLRRESLIWPAEILAELTLLKDAYDRRDARFAPAALALAFGEWAVRHDALHSATGAVPQLFVRGASSDRTVELASARLTGLGCAATTLPRGVRLTALLQEETGGQIVAVVREFADLEKSCATLATASVGRGVTLAALGGSNVLVRGGKRAPSGAFSFGRAPLSANPQAFAWERLRAPVLAGGFEEVAARLAALPPAALRPRRLGEDLHVVAVAEVEASAFDPVEQATLARLRDTDGGSATLFHPFRSSARAGTEALLAALASGKVLFVAGRFRPGADGPVVEPVGVVVAVDGGGRRLIQPHIEASSNSPAAPISGNPGAGRVGSLLTEELPALLGELLTVGVEAAGEREGRRLQELARTARARGFHRVVEPMDRLAETLSPDPLLTLTAIAALAATP